MLEVYYSITPSLHYSITPTLQPSNRHSLGTLGTDSMRRNDHIAYLFVSPYALHFAVFIGFPLVFSFVLVFHRWDIISPMVWIGWENFDKLLHDKLFWRAMMNTGIFLLLHIPLQIALALFSAVTPLVDKLVKAKLVRREPDEADRRVTWVRPTKRAVQLHERIRWRGFFRAAFFLPVVVSGVVVSILWDQLYARDTGVLNAMLARLGFEKIGWLTSPLFAMPSLALMATWKNVGLSNVLF